MRTSIKSRVLAVLGAMIMPIVAMADYTCTTNGYTFHYDLSGGNATINANGVHSYDGTLIVPAYLDGHPVKALSAGAFQNMTNNPVMVFEEGLETLSGRSVFWLDGSGGDFMGSYVDDGYVVLPKTVKTFGANNGAWQFRGQRTSITYDGEPLYNYYFAFVAAGEQHAIGLAGVPENMVTDNPPDTGTPKFLCRPAYYDAWANHCGADKFRGLVDDNYKYLDKAQVIFDSNYDGGGVVAKEYMQACPLGKMSEPTRLGYSFLGWYTKGYGEYGFPDGILMDKNDVVAGPILRLYAHWKAVKPTWNVTGTSVIYDGQPHGIIVVPTAPVEGVTVKYASVQEGPYTDVSPTLTEAGYTNVWYVLKAPDWMALTNSATLKITKLVSDATVSKLLVEDSLVFSGAAKRPSAVLKDTAAVPNLNVTAYAPGDADGDGVLSQNDVTLIQRYNAYQALSDAMKEMFASYNLTGSALVAADVNGDGVVNADDVAALNEKFNGYKMVEGIDYTLAYSDNVNAGTGKVTITGKGNYDGTAVLEFTIAPAVIGTNGEPGDGVVPEGGISKHDTTCTYDGLPHTVNTNMLAAVRINGLAPSIGYSLNGMDGWQAEPFVFTNACVTSIWYRLQVPNYADYVHEAQLTIAPKSIADRTVTSIISYDPSNGTGPEVTLVDQAIFRWEFVPPYSAGDVNGDGVLMDDDVMLIEQCLAYYEMDDSLKPFFEDYNLTGGALSAADYNGDGVVDSEDADALEVSFYTLVEGVDYTISVSVNVGSNVVSVTGLGNYSDSICQVYRTAVPFAVDDVTVAGFAGKYDGAAHGIGVTVKDGIEEVALKYACGALGTTRPTSGWSDELPTITDVGSMTVWCEIAAPGYITQTNSATVVISPREVTLTSGSASKVYDGTSLVNGNVTVDGDGFADGEGASYNVTGSQTNVGESENAFTYALNDNTKAGNYTITTVNGKLTVTKANVGGGIDGSDEPGGGEVPQGGESKFDTTAMYDGEGHTIDTNALVVAFGSVMVGESAVEYAVGDGTGESPVLPWLETAPVYTNAGEYVVWYRVTNPNYKDFVHAAKLSITKRPVTVTSGSASKSYDGTTLIEPEVIVGGNAFVAGEGATFNVTGCQIVPGASSNTFTYTLNDGTDADNYEISIVYGTLTVLKSASVIWYVDANKGSDSNDGFSWVSAKKSIQSAIDEAVSGNSIIVTNGVYSPIRSLDSNKILQISSVEGAEQTFIDGENSQRCVTSSARSVYYGESEPHSGLRLKGFTICNGNSRNESIDPKHGGGALGGVYENCIIKNNRVEWVSDWNGYSFGYGGGTSHAELVNCVVLSNYAVDGGGGIYEGKVINSLIEGNAVQSGDAMASGYGGGGACSALVSNCVIRSNYSRAGSAINDCSVYNSVISNHLDYATLYYANFHDCLIVNNWDGNSISGMGIADECNFYRCTISGNKARGVLTHRGSINDSIVFGNGDASLDARWTKYNNTWTSDPDFVDAANGDYRLKPISKCIDVGSEDCDAQFDLDGNPRIINGAIDLGCYESQNLYKKVDVPIIQDKVYNGLLQIANVGESEDYEVVSNVGGVSVGEYTVTLRLKDGMSRIWSDNTEGALKTLQWKIVAVEFDDWEDESKWAISFSGNEEKYDGVAKICDVTMLSYDGLPVTNFNVSGNSAIDAGEYTLTVIGIGNFSGLHTFKWSIFKRDVTLTSGSASKVYDGTALVNENVTVGGDGFVDGEGASYNVTGLQTNVGESENAFTYALNDNTKAGNYTITTVNGMLTVTKANVGGGTSGGEEPGDGEVPQGGVSKFDASFVYDGEGHTIDTNALKAAFGSAMVGASVIEYAVDDGTGESPVLPWLETAPVYTNAGEYVVWYRVTNPNYKDFVHAAKLSITKRPVTVTSADGSWTYDGQAHSNATVTCEGFVSGEGVVASNFATITDVGSVANAFTYAFADGTLAGNYLVTCVTGTLTISEAYKAFVIRCEWIEDAIRPATMDFMVQTNGVDWQIENVTAVDEWKRATDVKVYDRGVPIDYGLVALPAEGIRSEIEKLGCRTVGSLTRLDKVLTESGWNNVGLFTINSVVGTVDGWRRFGELRRSDLVIVEDTSKGVFFKVRNFKSTFDIDDGTDGTGGEASRFSYSGVYDGVGHGIGVEVANAPSGMTVKYARGNAGMPPSDGWSTINPLFTNVCDRAVVWYAVECAGYVSYTNSATVTISQKGVTVRADAKSRPYGQPDVPLTYTAEGLVAGDALGGALSRDPGEAAGTYSIRQGTLANANYAISYIGADYVIAKVSINPIDVFGGNGSEENPLVCEKAYNGSAQSVEIKPNFNEYYRFFWSLTKGDESSYSETAPTLRNVADGELAVYFKFVTENYEPYYGKVIFRILPKTLTDEMVVLTDEAFFYDPGSTVKKPSVTMSDTNAVGVVISTVDDYTVVYDEATSAGAVPVTVTGKNNYTGKVTKTFDVLKRPVAPPVIGTKAYNGRKQKATVPVGPWTVVKNDGGINVGEYEVVLRLTNPDDYRWKGVDEAKAEWTGVFRITKANNGWSRYPGILGWSIDEEPNDPTGQSRYGTLSVAYRKAGTEVATETSVKPSEPGDYIARFWVEGTENYIGVALTVHYEVAFTITSSDGIPSEETQTTPVPVPHVWLEKYVNTFGGGDFEKTANAKGANDVSLWESYVAGLDPEDATSRFTAKIEIGADGKAVVTWTPDLSKAEKPRKYTMLGKEKLGDDAWSPVTDDNKAKMRFFKVTVELK